MKKITLLFAVLLSVTAFSQTKNSALVGQVNTVVNYTDNLGNVKDLTLPNNTFHGADSITFNAFNLLIKSRVDTVAKIVAKVYSVSFLTTGVTLLGHPDPTKGVFTIYGEHYDPKTLRVSDLTGADATLAANFFTLVNSSTGNNLESSFAPFNTGKITINGVEMHSSTLNAASGGMLDALKVMCTDWFNKQ
ncbi:MAG: hypothetical protein V4538_16220 [Bacteroidota bacterium]